MTEEFKKGLVKAIIYYALGFGIAILSYVFIKHEYIHGPGLHHIIVLFVIIGGGALLVRNFSKLENKVTRGKAKGSILVHSLFILGTFIFIGIIMKEINNPDTIFNPEDSEYLIIDRENQTVKVENELGETIYIQKGDSLLLDKRNWSKEEK